MLVFGRVQMVMFRDFVKRKARRLGILGYVKNLDDGSVEIIAVGPVEKIDELFEVAKRGPIFARVDKYTIENIALAKKYDNFSILY